MSSVFRLKHTWVKVMQSKQYPKFQELKHLMTGKGGFKNYRQTLASTNPPCVPFFGVYQTDLTFIEEGNPDFLNVQGGRKDIINYDKMKKLAAVLEEIAQYQHIRYHFQIVPIIYEYFESALKMDYLTDNELYSLSLEVEPKIANTERK
eukprot:TRINITY_DN7686_c0_g1_i1.p1 TRINITY_DN7686_c0_g1~~TRINITY_DN7686_c0_g1_i1.p1  ORF type:complete len:149 (+),score=27.37 TRINITY_DN7686_c0_g1_i1:112-558(+)